MATNYYTGWPGISGKAGDSDHKMYELCKLFQKLYNTYPVRGDDLYSVKSHSQYNIKIMKIMIFLVALTIPLMGGITVTGNQSSTQKQQAAQTKVQYVKQDLNEAQKDTNAVVQKISATEDWKKFNKRDFEQKIKANEMRISELNEKIGKPSELFDAFYLQKIANLEKENKFLKSRVEAFNKSQSKIGSIQLGFL